MSNLDAFITTGTPSPAPLFTTQEIRDRASTFVGTLYRVPPSPTPLTANPNAKGKGKPTSTDLDAPAPIARLLAHHTHVRHAANPASHDVAAWRVLGVLPGRSGLGGPGDFGVARGWRDDGEKWAGERVLRVMEREGVLDAVVVVSRWYGGQLLGPARFTHIETCATEACRAFKVHEEIERCIADLHARDAELTQLRSQHAALRDQEPPKTKTNTNTNADVDGDVAVAVGGCDGNVVSEASRVDSSSPLKSHGPKDYSDLFTPLALPRAQRLVSARAKAVSSARASLARQRRLLAEATAQTTPGPERSRDAPVTSIQTQMEGDLEATPKAGKREREEGEGEEAGGDGRAGPFMKKLKEGEIDGH